MAITDQTRKRLWARAGNRCAICRKELVRNEAVPGLHSIVGDECHIVASSVSGPRGSHVNGPSGDTYDNLILLCPNDHTRVDQHPEVWPVDRLLAVKAEHEQWVATQLGTDGAGADLTEEGQGLLVRLMTGSELLSVIASAHLFAFRNDVPGTQAEADLLASFCQLLQDYGDLAGDMEAGGRVQAGFDLGRELEALREAGFVVFGSRRITQKSFRGVRGPWDVAEVAVVRSDSPAIVSFGPAASEGGPPKL